MIDSSSINVTVLSFFAVRISWTPPSDNLNDIIHYQLNVSYIINDQVIPNEEILTTKAINQQTLELPFNIKYQVMVRGINGVGYGKYSEAVPFVTATPSKKHYTNIYMFLKNNYILAVHLFLMEYTYSC